MVSRSSASLPAAARLLMATRRVPVARAVLLLWSKIGLATPDIIGMAASSNFSETDNCGVRPAPFPWRNIWREYQPKE